MLLFVPFVLCLSQLGVCQQSNGTLRSVVVITRHGDRTISGTYPNDPYKNISYWPGGFGQLTNKGKARLYNLGKWFRQRYGDFIPETYSLYDFYARSTDVDRTLMSAQAFLAGFYPPIHEQAWNPVLQWQPIPIHTLPTNEDAVLAESKPCPLYDALLDNLYQTDLAPIQEKLQPLYSYISIHSGKTMTTLEDLQNLHDTLRVEESFGYELPAWTKKVYPEELRTWAIVGAQIYCYTADMARLAVGPLLNEISANFLNSSRCDDGSYQRFKLYSGHETTINNVMTALGVHNNLLVPYGTALIFEFHRTASSASYVNILYRNSTVHEPYEMVLERCGFNCSLSSFIDIFMPLAVNEAEWDDECKLPDNSTEAPSENSATTIHSIAVVYCFCLLLVIVIPPMNN